MARRLKTASYLRERRRQCAAVRRLAGEFYRSEVPENFREICQSERVDSTEVMREIYYYRRIAQRPTEDPTSAPEPASGA